ncbi:hypothetical protein [Winogradskyella sp.]|uniref:hypothetical protein n=1 Tax=Winogradskyella sp. TaxID=1883156 RepID=UPI003AB81A2F
MNSAKSTFLILFLLINALSCDSSSDEINNSTTDDYNLLVVDDLGKVYEIGNNTGNIEQTGTINKQIDGTFLGLGTITSTEDKIYAIEYFYDPGPVNNLLIFDKQTGTTEIIRLEIPENLIGDENAIAGLTTYGSKLIAILTEDLYLNNNIKNIVSIDLETYQIEDLGITFYENGITSMEYTNDKVYISTINEGFLEINLNTSSVNNLQFSDTIINGGKLAVIDNNRIALMQFDHNNNITNDFKPVELDITNQTFTDKSNNNLFGYATPSGTSIYKNDEYINLFSSADLEIYYGILKCNFETNTIDMVTINSTTINRNMVIIGTVD